MATNGLLTNNLAYIPLPICSDCIYVKATKLPSWTKLARFINESKLVASVGDFLFVDLLVSNTPGLITHMYVFIMILTQIMLVIGSFWKLRWGNSLSKTYSTTQENRYLAPFIIYLYNSVNHQFMLKKYPHDYQHHHTPSDLSLNTDV